MASTLDNKFLGGTPPPLPQFHSILPQLKLARLKGGNNSCKFFVFPHFVVVIIIIIIIILLVPEDISLVGMLATLGYSCFDDDKLNWIND